MLFGPKKYDFAKEVTVTEFEAEVREERKEKAPRAKEQQPDLPDLLDLIEIPEDAILEAAEEAPPQELPPEKAKALLLADFIRTRSRGAKITSKALLAQEEENLDELLQALKEDESCADIVSTKGDKDEYYYSNEFMSDNYAMIAVLVEEQNLPKTIAKMVRWNCKTYPSPTPIRYFMASPYFYSEAEIERSLEVIQQSEEYEDIKNFTTGNNVKYLYSTLYMTERYAKALAEAAEWGEYGY